MVELDNTTCEVKIHFGFSSASRLLLFLLILWLLEQRDCMSGGNCILALGVVFFVYDMSLVVIFPLLL